MEYSIRQVSEMAGISARTLRYYDEIGLLKPLGVSDAGYRFYGEKEISLLQQILFYRERGIRLDQIGEILYDSSFDTMSALEEHLKELEKQLERTEKLIRTVKNTIMSRKGAYVMTNQEKFEAFKIGQIEKNEEQYGKEVREKYGDAVIDASNRKLLGMSEEEYANLQELEREVRSLLHQMVKEGKNAESKQAEALAGLHRQWLQMCWNTYSSEAHRGLVEMYTADERFRMYYDKEISGCAQLLKESVQRWV